MATYKFLSDEWVSETAKVLKTSVTPAATDSATLSIAMTVQKCPDGKEKTLVFETDKGTLKTFKLADPALAKTEFGITGDYATFQKVFKGQLDPTGAIMGGELKFRGNMLKAMGLVKGLTPLFTVLGKIPTEF